MQNIRSHPDTPVLDNLNFVRLFLLVLVIERHSTDDAMKILPMIVMSSAMLVAIWFNIVFSETWKNIHTSFYRHERHSSGGLRFVDERQLIWLAQFVADVFQFNSHRCDDNFLVWYPKRIWLNVDIKFWTFVSGFLLVQFSSVRVIHIEVLWKFTKFQCKFFFQISDCIFVLALTI